MQKKETTINLDDFQTELSIKENNSQVDFSNHKALKKLLMQNISNKRLDIENGIMTKRGYILNIIDLNNPTILDGLDLTTINVEPHFDCDKLGNIQMDAILKESNNRVFKTKRYRN